MTHGAYPGGVRPKRSKPLSEDITDLIKVNDKLTKQFPDDFALKINKKQLLQIKNERVDYPFVCTNGDCLCQVTLSITHEQYNSRFYFSRTMECPVCARIMYEVGGEKP